MSSLGNAIRILFLGPDPEQCLQTKVPDYALLFFDHLYSEYLALKEHIHDQGLIHLLDSIYDKRVAGELTWSDIYAFDLALIDVRPLENLVRKAYEARSKYRSIAGQKEYDEYVASKPPDLTAILIKPGVLTGEPGTPEIGITSPPITSSPITSPPITSPPLILSPPVDEPAEPGIPEAEAVRRLVSADIRYLLSKFYLYYAMLPLRECLRDQLTTQAVRVTCLSMIAFAIFLSLSLGIGRRLLRTFWDPNSSLTASLGLTIGAVVFFGILGGCVSMLQRIQSAPTEGDALLNVAAITNGWRGLSLSPLYGGIFATLLFIMFAAQIVQGTVFPKIKTAAGSQILVNVQEQTANTAAPAATPNANAQVPAAPSPPTETQKTGVLQLKDFLTNTGPEDGVSFALLMIWSFIAGFAERLVPDTLNRLVAKTEAIQGTNA